MADTPTHNTKAATPVASAPKKCCAWTDWTWAAILLRLCAGMLLLLSGTDKFKSATSPATYSTDNYYGSAAELAEGKVPKMVKIVNVVFTNSGLDNPANAFVGTAGRANFFAWTFYRFGQVLPWAMIASGLMILLGFFSRIGHFIGGSIWISLIAGQLLLPDIETVVRLLVVFLVSVGALALVQHNRIRITKC
jgi:uncharacterized membrane protein YphA (DoxX/SURF4 family)